MSEKASNPLDMFVEGARKGWQVATHSMLPNVIMAFVIIKILDVTGLLGIIGKVAGPAMVVFGLPGEAIIVLVTAFMSMGGGCGAAASLYTSGALNGIHISILMPAIFLMGAMLQYMGRCLGVSEANTKYWGLHIVICILNALLSMLVMRGLLVLFS